MSNNNQPIRLLQITDCHLGDQLLGLDTEESLIDVLQLIAAEQPAPDLVLATGDIAGCHLPKAYERFLELTGELFTAPVAWLPGNHDSPAMMTEALQGDTMPRTITVDNWIMILLDSTVRGYEHGNLRDEELDFLDQTLKSHPTHYAMVFLHHQPVPVGSAWVDQYIVRNAKKFFSIVDKYPHIRGISWGHVHQVFYTEHKGIPLWSTPSTSVQFKPQSDNFIVDHTMPGYRWYDLYPDGHLVTDISRIAEKPYAIDYGSSGY